MSTEKKAYGNYDETRKPMSVLQTMKIINELKEKGYVLDG